METLKQSWAKATKTLNFNEIQIALENLDHEYYKSENKYYSNAYLIQKLNA